MLLINSKNEYPRYIGDLQIEHEGWQEGDSLPDGWSQVEPTEPPTFNSETECIFEKQPVKRNGQFYQVWDKRNFTDDELATIERERIKFKVINNQSLTAEEAATLT
jgi:hypothetical protein